MSDQPIYIIGHKNPDTDSVCSALAYAALKHAQGQHQYLAARCGNSNSRIDAVLNQFKVPLPTFVGDVTPRVRDIMRRDMHLINDQATCAQALDIIEKYDLRAIPVIKGENELAGMISVFHLGEFFIPKPNNTREIRHVQTSIREIVDALGARVINLKDPDVLEDLYVRVGAMDIRSFGRFVDKEATKPEESIIIVGDRWDIQQKAIQMGVRLLIITGNQDVEQEVLDMANERDISIIISPYDSATTAWVTRTATRLQPMIEKDTVIFHPDDTLEDVRKRVSKRHAMVYMVADDDNHLLGIFSNSDIIKPVERSIVLVDHNELSQAVNGANQVNILEIIDHHRLGNPPTQQPILFHNIPVGSTCTIVAMLYRQNGLTPEASIAGLMMGGIISDTLKLQSPTSTPLDKEILQWLESLSGMNTDRLAEIIFQSGSLISTNTPEKVISTDCKIYNEGNIRFSVSQIEELGFDNFWKDPKSIAEALSAYRKENDLHFSTLLVTDVRTQNSLLVVSGSETLKDAISYPHVEEDYIFDMPGIVSRKKQLIPHLTELIGRVDLERAKED